jgi:hypothetical protein
MSSRRGRGSRNEETKGGREEEAQGANTEVGQTGGLALQEGEKQLAQADGGHKQDEAKTKRMANDGFCRIQNPEGATAFASFGPA